jgi:hypothetical protein
MIDVESNSKPEIRSCKVCVREGRRIVPLAGFSWKSD